MAPPPPSNHNPTYYEILNLSPSALSSLDPTSAAQLIKRAYRRALLNHHPDKKGPNRGHRPLSSTTNTTIPPASSSSSSSYTIDQISTAYATLSHPSQRQAYDLSLHSITTTTTGRTGPGGLGGGPEPGLFQTGIETLDLDDLDYEEYVDTATTNSSSNGAESITTTRWYRSCRCGNPRGYHFTEADLEEAADLGELMVGCADCSLWLRVHFAVVNDDDDEGDDEGSGPENGDRNGDGDGAAGTVVSG
jgi:curved DNA-binding protein CbpA